MCLAIALARKRNAVKQRLVVRGELSKRRDKYYVCCAPDRSAVSLRDTGEPKSVWLMKRSWAGEERGKASLCKADLVAEISRLSCAHDAPCERIVPFRDTLFASYETESTVRIYFSSSRQRRIIIESYLICHRPCHFCHAFSRSRNSKSQQLKMVSVTSASSRRHCRTPVASVIRLHVSRSEARLKRRGRIEDGSLCLPRPPRPMAVRQCVREK